MLRFLQLCSFLILPFNVFAQGGHYWTESFGTRSMLLNGVAIGSAEDLGVVYYNPARISQLENSSFIISGKVIELKKINIENGLGDGLDLEQSDFGSGPSLVAGTFKLKFLEGHHFAYSFLTRTQSDNTFNFSINEFGDFIKAFPGEEFFSGELLSSSKLKDEWLGLSWSYPINNKLSVGFSGYYSSLQREAFLKVQLQAFRPDSSRTAMSIEKRAYEFKSSGVLGKFGVSWNDENYSLGLTITTPKLNIGGSGSTKFETFLAGVDTTGNGINDDIYTIDGQENLDVNKITPWAIGVGGGVTMGRAILHLSAEWYSSVDRYTILESNTFIAQSTGEMINQIVIEDLQSVLNYGIGLEVGISEKMSLFGSFATDFSASSGGQNRLASLTNIVDNTSFRADIFHFGFGADIKTKVVDFIIGTTYATAKESFIRNFEIEEGSASTTETADIIFNRWLFILGFEFHFSDKN